MPDCSRPARGSKFTQISEPLSGIFIILFGFDYIILSFFFDFLPSSLLPYDDFFTNFICCPDELVLIFLGHLSIQVIEIVCLGLEYDGAIFLQRYLKWSTGSVPRFSQGFTRYPHAVTISPFWECGSIHMYIYSISFFCKAIIFQENYFLNPQ